MLAIFLVYSGGSEIREVFILRTVGTEGKAKITNLETQENSQGETLYFIYYQRNSTSPEIKEGVSVNIYQQYQIGQEIEVLFDLNDPTIIKIKSEELSYNSGIFRLVMGVGLLILVIVYLIRLYR